MKSPFGTMSKKESKYLDTLLVASSLSLLSQIIFDSAMTWLGFRRTGEMKWGASSGYQCSVPLC